MPSYLSINEFPGDGVTTQHEFSFAGGYIDKSHVKASIYDALGAQTIVTITEPMWIGPYILNLGVAAPVGGHTRIYRDTPREEPLADFADRARLREANLDLLARQAIFVGAEAFDAGAYAEVNDLLGQAAASAAASLAAANDAGDSVSAAAAQVALAALQVAAAAAQVAIATAEADAAQAAAAAAEAFAASIDPGQFVLRAGSTMTGQLIVPILNGGQQAGHRNKLVNGDFSQNVRTATSFADGAYCMDNWFVLTESGNVTRTQLTDPESGAINGIRLTQPDASPKRMGFGQVVESRSVRQFASTAMHLAARLRLSTGTNIRYAVLEHTGTADVVTRDVVNNWASATFTPANFFIAGVNVISTGTIAPGAATWGEVSDWDALGASVKNVIVFVWTESQVAQNVTLDCSRIQYEPGVISTPHEWRHDESRLTSRFVRLNSTGIGGSTSTTQVAGCAITFDAPMVASPTVTLQNGTNALLDPAVATRTATAITGASTSSRGVYVDLTVAATTNNKVHVLLGGAILISAEL